MYLGIGGRACQAENYPWDSTGNCVAGTANRDSIHGERSVSPGDGFVKCQGGLIAGNAEVPGAAAVLADNREPATRGVGNNIGGDTHIVSVNEISNTLEA